MLQLGPSVLKLRARRAFPSDLDSAGELAMTNGAAERLLSNGKFKGARRWILVSVGSTGILTAPRTVDTVLGARVDGTVRDLAGQHYRYLQCKSDNTDLCNTVVQDQGSGYCTFADPTASCRLTLISGTATDVARVTGLDENGVEIFSGGAPGVDVTCNVISTQHFTSITSIILPETDAVKTLRATYGDATTQTLATYAPGETGCPDYRRYLVGDALNAVTAPAVEALVQLKHVDAVNDNDLLWLSSFEALKLGVDALYAEDQGDESRAKEKTARAVQLLNQELRRSRPESERGVIRVNVSGQAIGSGMRTIL